MARLPNAQEAGLSQIVEIHHHARAEAERADAAARFLRDDAADGERHAADEQRIADGEAELREQLRPHQRAVVREHRVRELAPVLQEHLAVERKARLHARAARPCARPARPSRPAAAPSSPRRSSPGARRSAPSRTASRDPPAPRASTADWCAMATSAAISARDSRVSPFRTVWIIERSATIAPDADRDADEEEHAAGARTRGSRASAIEQTNMISRLRPSDSATRARSHRSHRQTTRPSRRAIVMVGLAGELWIVRDEHDGRRCAGG